MSGPSGFVSWRGLTGLGAIVAAVLHEADYQLARVQQGPDWTRERHARWLEALWFFSARGVR